jgi:hypothetical protein
MSNDVDHWTWSETSFQNWRSAVDRRLKDMYLIGLDDAGIDNEYLKPHWEGKQSPYEFVEWHTLKYDLEPKTAFWL